MVVKLSIVGRKALEKELLERTGLFMFVCMCAFLSLGRFKVLICTNFPMLLLLKCLLVVLILHSTVAIAKSPKQSD